MIFDCSILKPIYCSDTGTGTGPDSASRVNNQVNRNDQGTSTLRYNNQNNTNNQPGISSTSTSHHAENRQGNTNVQGPNSSNPSSALSNVEECNLNPANDITVNSNIDVENNISKNTLSQKLLRKYKSLINIFSHNNTKQNLDVQNKGKGKVDSNPLYLLID
jgi:hypothetical protein